MGRCIFKLAFLTILCCIAFFCIRIAYNIFKDDINSWCNNVQPEKVSDISASTSDLTIEHNAERDGMFGMYIHSKQNYRNLNGIACYTALYFFDDQGNPLIGKRFKDANGNFCFIAPPLIPETDNVTNEQRSFIPYDEFSLPETGTVYFNCELTVYIENNKKQRTKLASSSISRFHLSR